MKTDSAMPPDSRIQGNEPDIGSPDLEEVERMPATQPWPLSLENRMVRLFILVPFLKEELVVERRPLAMGSMHLHQRLESGEARVQASTVRENVAVEHIAASVYDPTEPKNPDVVAIIPIMEEQLVVTKRRVVVEYMLIRKTKLTESQEVRDMVRRAVLDIDDQSQDLTVLHSLLELNSLEDTMCGLRRVREIDNS